MVYITITGMQHYFGIEAFKIGQKIMLEKDVENDYDSEAVRVLSESGNKLGYVANSVYTVAKGTHSAGWIGHLIEEDKRLAKVMFITGHSVIAEIVEKESVV
ncbi:MAG: DNA-binding protein [Erysipelotrichia bacterium]|nr:DNA-binding protein [Erysipelotrichia bacterium]NCC54742.1 DNA-binding protein [Erysipelotrichia bacterium]